MTQTITALYDTPAEAQTAMGKLVAAGIPQGAIRIVPGKTTTETSTSSHGSTSYDHKRDEGGFWGSLKDVFMPEEDRYTYSEGLNRGGTLLTASVEDAHVDAAMDILEENGSIDLDERETTWRKEGWSGFAGGSTTTGTTALAAGATRDTAGAAAVGGQRAETDTIPIVEERLSVGKRIAENGRVRVRSYAVETPVSEQVSLREETVHIDRRSVDRPATAADEALFAEKTIEAVEHTEQAVVSKDARVVEEVGLRKDAAQRTETVTDTVRRTEVEVEDERGNVSRTGTTGTTGGKAR